MASHTGFSSFQAFCVLGDLPRTLTNSCKRFSGRRRAACSAALGDVEVWKSVVQNHSLILLPAAAAVVPLLETNRARQKFGHFVSELRSLSGAAERRAFRSLLTVLILANAFYSDIAPPNVVDTFENVPQDLSGGDKPRRIQRPKSKKAEGCTQKCLGTCIRGGAGSPGEGPFNVRRPMVVFKEGFRSRQYCLIECSDICNLIGDGDSGP
ncbi:hypothetical protein MPTK1_1g23940 [Marchantia polymorpha subsp. ruderalis]|uniref:Uncharacterized protein n=2 Tax=Marchantia polymorpha TaxID=3197 RepID=A0A176WDM8_MARPO|nr:hypothetical protein AXG93_3233s1040 [Marchantia polymorpha subsp. ruderalis]PTQ36881.1 hypothetical protein MARPO_0061s0126 [Marchantia polymorpha]BBM99803.1 hypothetical protein Mp_1g23940 [Marchantia polymorpha subsp. ruderalis]|eukprot:PTQ36881.1 hypothetical protein MARPO_0061s0126 [Marchantia polymorpha]